MTQKTALVVKFGGSNAITTQGANLEYLRSFLSHISNHLVAAQKVAIVIGGGIRCRMLQEQVETAEEKDRVGIQSTWEHAQQMTTVLKELGLDPYDGIPNSPAHAKRLFEKGRYFAMGGLQIGQSTDAVSAFAATRFQKMGFKPQLFILSNVNAIYTADPKKDPAAKAIRKSSVETLVQEKILTDNPNDWRPGMSVTIDPVAVKILKGSSKHQSIPLYFGHGDDWKNVQNVLEGEHTTDGTYLKPGQVETVYY